jgi:N-acetylmuramoyl-L-alanine amidase
MRMSQPLALMVLFINPLTGSDRGNGSQTHPFQTITHALTVATPGITTLQLSPGTYSAETGEQFPLCIPAGVTVLGHESSQGRGIVILGGGSVNSPSYGKQCIALSLDDETCLQGITVTNPHPGGTGVWIESVRSAIAHCTIERCTREGVFVTGNARVEIQNSIFQHNGTSGLSMVRHAKGRIQGNLFHHTGYGLVISDHAAPLLLKNLCLANRLGLVVARSASPVLRQNRIEASVGDGLMVTDAAQPDLGHSQDPGNNRFSCNGGVDLRHLGSKPLLSAGNLLSPVRVHGAIAFAPIQLDSDTSLMPKVGALGRLPAPFLSTELIAPTPILPSLPPSRSALPPESIPLKAIAGHWAAPYIQALVNQGVFRNLPEGQFQPDQIVTRADYAALVARTFSLPARYDVPDFRDLPDWAAGAIATAVQTGFLAGFPDGSVRLKQPLTRWEAIASVVSGLGLSGGHLAILSHYRDYAEIPSEGAIAIATATQRRLVVNYPDSHSLRPLAPITQAELAALLYHAWVLTLQVAAIPSPYLVQPAPVGPSFSDLTGHWATEFIRGVTSQGLMTGYADGTFRPNVPITRADLAILLASVFNHLPERAAPAFKDVAPDFWAAAAIARTFRLGLMSGFDDQTFRPNQTVARLQLILALVNGLELPLDDAAAEIEAPSYARSAIASAIAHQLVVSFPDPTCLELTRAATRAEAAVMVYQTLTVQGRSPALSSPFLVSQTPIQSTQKMSQRVVILDPGHGGSDTGVVSSLGVQEKDITLTLCQAIAKRLRQQSNLRVILTRIDDRKLSNEQRLQTVQRIKADVVISVHLGSTNPADPGVNGLRTYYLEASAQSQAIAQTLHNDILNNAQILDQGVVSARFPLLRLAPVPVVQIDAGYLTGAEDSQRLTDPTTRALLVKAIAQSIQQLVTPKG